MVKISGGPDNPAKCPYFMSNGKCTKDLGYNPEDTTIPNCSFYTVKRLEMFDNEIRRNRDQSS